MSFDWITKLAEGDSVTVIAFIAIMLVAAQFLTAMATLHNSRNSKQNGNTVEKRDAKWTETISVMAETISDTNRQHNERVTEIMTPVVKAVQVLGTLPEAIRAMQQCNEQTANTLLIVAQEMTAIRQDLSVVTTVHDGVQRIAATMGNVSEGIEHMKDKQDTLQNILDKKLGTIINTLEEINRAQPGHFETTETMLGQLNTIQESINRLIDIITDAAPPRETRPPTDDTIPNGG